MRPEVVRAKDRQPASLVLGTKGICARGKGKASRRKCMAVMDSASFSQKIVMKDMLAR